MERWRRHAVDSLLADGIQPLRGVVTAIVEEFSACASVVRTQTGRNLLAATVLLIRRNTRRYGGYIIHFGIVVDVHGIAGGRINQAREMEMAKDSSIDMVLTTSSAPA